MHVNFRERASPFRSAQLPICRANAASSVIWSVPRSYVQLLNRLRLMERKNSLLDFRVIEVLDGADDFVEGILDCEMP